MAKNIDAIARRLGAKVIGRVPEVGGGAFDAGRPARIFEQLRARRWPGSARRAAAPRELGTAPESSEERGNRAPAGPPGRAGKRRGAHDQPDAAGGADP
jgi:hypothetical protein